MNDLLPLAPAHNRIIAALARRAVQQHLTADHPAQHGKTRQRSNQGTLPNRHSSA